MDEQLKKMLKRILHIILDLVLAFLLIEVCDVDDVSSYFAGLSTIIIWIQTDKIFKE